MNEQSGASAQVGPLVGRLADADAAVREEARKQLVKLGGPEVTAALVLALHAPEAHVRWEAAKAFQALADPLAASALMHALDDNDADVRWVAGEALVALKEVGLVTVLSGLIKRAGSTAYCKSAHHVLHEMKDYQSLVKPVLESLGHFEPAVAAPVAAYQALVNLNDASQSQ